MRSGCIVVLVFIMNILSAQTEDIDRGITLGPELQVYPTGLLPGIRLEINLDSKSSLNLRIAAQIIDHRDLGVQDDETGNGYGISIGYRRFFKSTVSGWSLAGRVDYWKNTIDWQSNGPPEVTGTSKITVLQPTALLEYKFPSQSSISITPSLGLGYEWNIKTDGEPTGEGAILLIGVFVGFQL